MQKLQKFLNFAILGVEASHIFCCVLPTIFSLLSLMVGLGVIGAMPVGILNFHDAIHVWEIPIIITSGLVILLGWALHDYAQKMDCANMGPGHEICEPRKKTTAKILKIATVLFVINVTIYALVHVPMEGELAQHHGHDHGHHHYHHGHAH